MSGFLRNPNVTRVQNGLWPSGHLQSLVSFVSCSGSTCGCTIVNSYLPDAFLTPDLPFLATSRFLWNPNITPSLLLPPMLTHGSESSNTSHPITTSAFCSICLHNAPLLGNEANGSFTLCIKNNDVDTWSVSRQHIGHAERKSS